MDSDLRVDPDAVLAGRREQATGFFGLRQDETLPAPIRRPMTVGTLWMALKEVLSDRMAMVSTVVMTPRSASIARSTTDEH